MAFLKETERTLRAYFIIVGALAVITALVALSALFAQGGSGRYPPVTTSAVVPLAILFPSLARLVLGSAFVIAGFGLKRALETGARGPLTSQSLLLFAATRRARSRGYRCSSPRLVVTAIPKVGWVPLSYLRCRGRRPRCR